MAGRWFFPSGVVSSTEFCQAHAVAGRRSGDQAASGADTDTNERLDIQVNGPLPAVASLAARLALRSGQALAYRRTRGVWRLYRALVPLLFRGPKVAPFLRRFRFVANGSCEFKALMACGFVHRDLDRAIQACLAGIARDGKINFFDIGANEAFVSLLACSGEFARGRVRALCFDPSPEALAVASQNVQLNAFNIDLFPIGLSDVVGKATLVLQDADSSFAGRDIFPAATGVEAEVTTLDAFCSGSGIYPDIIKIDVEGWEPKVLAGAEKVLRERRPVLFSEVNPKMLSAAGSSVRELLSLLRSLGYDLYDVDPTLGSSVSTGKAPAKTWGGLPGVQDGDRCDTVLWDVAAVPRD